MPAKTGDEFLDYIFNEAYAAPPKTCPGGKVGSVSELAKGIYFVCPEDKTDVYLMIEADRGNLFLSERAKGFADSFQDSIVSWYSYEGKDESVGLREIRDNGIANDFFKDFKDIDIDGQISENFPVYKRGVENGSLSVPADKPPQERLLDRFTAEFATCRDRCLGDDMTRQEVIEESSSRGIMKDILYSFEYDLSLVPPESAEAMIAAGTTLDDVSKCYERFYDESSEEYERAKFAFIYEAERIEAEPQPSRKELNFGKGHKRHVPVPDSREEKDPRTSLLEKLSDEYYSYQDLLLNEDPDAGTGYRSREDLWSSAGEICFDKYSLVYWLNEDPDIITKEDAEKMLKGGTTLDSLTESMYKSIDWNYESEIVKDALQFATVMAENKNRSKTERYVPGGMEGYIKAHRIEHNAQERSSKNSDVER